MAPTETGQGPQPHELAECVVAHKIQDEPAFAWWVRDTLQQRVRIISKLKPEYWHTTHKFGIRLPKELRKHYELTRKWGPTSGQRRSKRNYEKYVLPGRPMMTLILNVSGLKGADRIHGDQMPHGI